MTPKLPREELLPAVECADQPLLEFLSEIHTVESHRCATGSMATIDDYKIQVRILQRFFDQQCKANQVPARPLRLSDVNDYLLAGAMRHAIGQGRSKATANKMRRTIRALHSHAIARGFNAVPLRVKAFHEPRQTPEAWLMPEVEKMLVTAREMRGSLRDSPVGLGEFFHALLLFLFNTGSRITAAMTTPTTGLDLERGFVTIPAHVQKHRHDESFELLPQTMLSLRNMRVKERGLVCIFDDWPWDRSHRQWPQLHSRLKEIVLAAGLAREGENLRLKCFHRWRKTFASYVASSKGLSVASQMLGHSCVEVTQRYLDPRITGERKVANVLPSVVVKLRDGDSDEQLEKIRSISEALRKMEAEFGVKVALAASTGSKTVAE